MIAQIRAVFLFNRCFKNKKTKIPDIAAIREALSFSDM
jgi:hypothetical protein